MVRDKTNRTEPKTTLLAAVLAIKHVAARPVLHLLDTHQITAPAPPAPWEHVDLTAVPFCSLHTHNSHPTRTLARRCHAPFEIPSKNRTAPHLNHTAAALCDLQSLWTRHGRPVDRIKALGTIPLTPFNPVVPFDPRPMVQWLTLLKVPSTEKSALQHGGKENCPC